MTEPPVTNLSEKFTALQDLLISQHTALMAEISALRGTAPNNTLASVTQSLTNIAADTTLAQLKTTIEAVAGGKSISDLVAMWSGQLTDPKPYDVLANILGALTASGLSQTAANDLLTRIIYQFDTPFVTPTMKELVSNISGSTASIAENTADPLTTVPSDMCATYFSNTGIEYVSITAQLIEPMTYATWPTTVPAGFNITTEQGGIALGQTIVRCTDWTQYKIYVASRASQFGVSAVNLQKFSTNQWITLSGNNFFEFYVNGNENLKVYICPV